MLVFVYEYTEALGEAAPHGLRVEGRAMLAAVVEDFARLAGVEVVTLGSGPLSLSTGLPCRTVRPGREEESFRALARAADYTLVIAPEFDDILRQRCAWVEACGGRLLGPSADAVRRTGDKLALARHLRRRGVPTPACRPFPDDSLPFPIVWKPRFGAGSLATFLVHRADEWPKCLAAARSEVWEGESVVQPWVPGRPASVAVLSGPRGHVALVPVTQDLSSDGRFHYRGGRLPLPEPAAGRAVRLALQAAAAVPGLAGYVGVDVVLGDAADDGADWVIEINPRLTTSYVGLRAYCRGNLAAAMLAAVRGEELPPLEWHPGALRFRPDGSVQGC